jgi:hypothetical protein
MTAGERSAPHDSHQAVLLEALVATSERAMLAQLDAEGPWDQRLRNCFGVFVDAVVAQPAAARACLVEPQLAGPTARAAVDRAARTVGRRALAVAEESPARAGMPRDVARAVLGGLRNVVQSRLYDGREQELRALAPHLTDWALGYRTPPEALRGARRPEGLSAVPAPPARPDPNRHAGREVRLVEASLPACRSAADWARAVRDGLAALLAYLSSDPAAARLTAEAGWTGGLAGLQRLDAETVEFQVLLADGLRSRSERPDAAAEAIGASVIALVHDHLGRHAAPERLYEVAPAAAFTALAPAIGTIEACAVVNDPV